MRGKAGEITGKGKSTVQAVFCTIKQKYSSVNWVFLSIYSVEPSPRR